jgi:hypothetical protein
MICTLNNWASNLNSICQLCKFLHFCIVCKPKLITLVGQLARKSSWSCCQLDKVFYNDHMATRISIPVGPWLMSQQKSKHDQQWVTDDCILVFMYICSCFITFFHNAIKSIICPFFQNTFFYIILRVVFRHILILVVICLESSQDKSQLKSKYV